MLAILMRLQQRLESIHYGADPAITGEPSEEQLIQPSRTERVGPSSPADERRTPVRKRGGTAALAHLRDVVPVPVRHRRHAPQ